jgi:hypothetical protein
MSGDEYRCKAAEMRAKARQATSLSVKRECECLAERYIRLAEMAEINSHTNVVYEPPPVRLRDATPPTRTPDRRLPGA